MELREKSNAEKVLNPLKISIRKRKCFMKIIKLSTKISNFERFF